MGNIDHNLPSLINMSNNPNIKSKYFCFTLNNWTEAQLHRLREITMVENSWISYISWAQEVGEEGTPHLQGYLECTKEARYKQVMKFIGFNLALFKRKASCGEDAQDYFENPENHNKPGPAVGFEFYGTMSKNRKGKRNDLEDLKRTLDSGASLAEVASEHFGSFVRYEKSIRSYKRLKLPKRDWLTEVHVLYGDTGTGKTRRVYEQYPGVYFHPGGPWFDGYEGEEVVIFDEFSGSSFALPYFLKLTDRYPMQVPFKGGFVNWCPKKIFITSNMPPADWYPNAIPEHKMAMARRFTDIEEFRDPNRGQSTEMDFHLLIEQKMKKLLLEVPEEDRVQVPPDCPFPRALEMNAGGQSWN